MINWINLILFSAFLAPAFADARSSACWSKAFDDLTASGQVTTHAIAAPPRIRRAEKLLHRPLSEKEKRAIEFAHLIGEGEIGRNGGRAGVYNYTDRQLRSKATLLAKAGFSRDERRILVEKRIVGKPTQSNPDFRVVEDLVNRKLLTRAEMRKLTDKEDVSKLEQLKDAGRLSEDDFYRLNFVYGPMPVNPPIGPIKTLEFTLKNPDNSPQKTKLLFYEAEPMDQADRGLVLADPSTKKPIAFVEYDIDDSGSRVGIVNMEVKTNRQGVGLSGALYDAILKLHPNIKAVKAQLSGTNLKALEEALKDHPLPEAVTQTPMYKERLKRGFKTFNLRTQEGKNLQGRPYIRYDLESTRP